MKLSIILISCLISVGAAADWTTIPDDDMKIDPAPTAEVETKEVAELLKIQAKRTAEDCQFAGFAANSKTRELYLGHASLTNDEVDRAMPVLEKVAAVAKRVAGDFKEKYKRHRPYSADKRIKPCVDLPGNSQSYPSGHTVHAMATACTLEMIYPEKAKAIREYADKLAEQRLIGGVHFPSDVEAGKKLAEQLCRKLKGNAEFKAAVKQAAIVK